jgi:hypothetical protein
MMARLPAIAAFATAALQLAALMTLLLRGGATTLEPAKLAFQLYLWPIPLATGAALLGVLAVPVSKPALIWIGGILLGLSAAVLCLTSSVVLSVLSGEGRLEAMVILFIAPWPALMLAGAGVAMVGHKLAPVFGASVWFGAIGYMIMGLALVAALSAHTFVWMLPLALLVLAVWWGWLGVVLSRAPSVQTSVG